MEDKYTVSEYRTSLMGFAMLWIMLYHIGIDISYLNPLTRSGYLGVDIFIFLSSYGLYYSMKNNKTSIINFYKKRLIRILPTYYIVLILMFIISGVSAGSLDFNKLLQDVSFIGFFFPCLKWSYFLWYIPAIIFLYFLFPLLFRWLSYIKRPDIIGLVFYLIGCKQLHYYKVYIC